ncbi:hypothetical protein LR48_Vigan07g158800 [Vigna angularis]|uniref:Cytochrome P450 n=1 Tax=Phaseolus angularis TaxID=3914 RepID=A0A0L9UZB0_PHAAN|nr:hypothetical protein LR48_Vigan07g158800 [Vigna angularis]
MEYLLPLLLLITILCVTIHVLISTFKPMKTSKYPPGPYPFPIIGNILELRNLPHQKLAKLSQIYGPIMSLKLGSITTIVISSPHLAREVLQTKDQIFSNRKLEIESETENDWKKMLKNPKRMNRSQNDCGKAPKWRKNPNLDRRNPKNGEKHKMNRLIGSNTTLIGTKVFNRRKWRFNRWKSKNKWQKGF